MIRPATIVLVATVRHRIELRRRRDHPQLGLAVAAMAIFGSLAIVGSLPLPYYETLWPQPGAYRYGTLVDERPAAVLERARAVAAVGFVAVFALGALGATTSDDWESRPIELLTAVPVPTAVLGVLGGELLENGWFVAPIAVTGSLAFAAGTGGFGALAGAIVGGFAVALSGLLGGTAAGLSVRAAIRRSPRLYAARFPIGLVAVAGTFVTLAASRTAGSVLGETPLGTYGDLLLITAPGGGADPFRALGAVVITAGIAASALAACVVSTRHLWFAEKSTVDDREEPSTDWRGEQSTDGRSEPSTAERAEPSVLDALLARRFSRPTAAVVRAVWRRTRRSPRSLLYVTLPLAFVGPITAEVIDYRPTLVPAFVALYAASAVGLGTTLNPLGNERIALPLVLSTPGGRRAIVRGHALAALLPGLPLVAVAAVAAGSGIGYPPPALLALVTVAVALAAGGVGCSLAIGTLLPNFSGPSTGSGALTPPDVTAMAAYLLAMAVLATPAIVGFALGPGSPVGFAGVAFTLALTGAVGRYGYRRSARAIDRYEAGEHSV